MFVNDYVSQFERDEVKRLTFKSQARAAVDDGHVRRCTDYLNVQSNALSLLLIALNRFVRNTKMRTK